MTNSHLLIKCHIWVLIVGVGITLGGCQPPIKNLDSKGKNIICFGDSITWGEGLNRKDAFPAILEKLLKRKVINAGNPGDTTFDALKRLKRDVLDRDPYLVIVELGGNDFLQKVAPQDTFNNIEKIIRRIQDKGAIVVLCDVSCGFVLSGYRKEFKRIARRYGTIFVARLLEGILDDPSLKVDFIHPNKRGHILIAQRIYERLRKWALFQ